MADRRSPAVSRARTTPPTPADSSSSAGSGADTPSASADPWWSLPRAGQPVAVGWYLLPLRLFLGVTFLFAGLQKLANPNFFHDASPISIHAQLVAATRSSPIHALVSPLVHVSTPVGILIALGELAVATGTLLGFLTRAAAVGGLLLNFLLFLTVSFHSSPYFTGSDIVFVFAWTPFILAGAGGAPAIDTWLARQRAVAGSTAGSPAGIRGIPRRAVLSTGAAVGAVAAGVVVLGGVAAALGRAVGGAATPSTGTRTLSTSPTTSTPSTTSPPSSTPSSTTGSSTTTTGAAPKGTAIGAASDVPVGSGATFTDPKSGDPAIVLQRSTGHFVAFDAICPHAGCTVAFQASSDIIACPCHGSEFNPNNGNVVHGPAATGLLTIHIAEGPNGQLYVDG